VLRPRPADARARPAACLWHQSRGRDRDGQQDRARADRLRSRRRRRHHQRSYQQLLLASARGKSLGQRLRPWLRLRPRYFKPVLPAVVEPRTGLSMGQSTELMAQRWGIGREEQDRLACESHMKAAAAWREGFYQDLVVPYLGLKTDN